ncbi:hypothetical protein OAK24_01065 [Flavobacteriales bacterium]|nr:hypothetical protein [Flavobacteriales bacterium]
MKKIPIILIAFLFAFTAVAQEKINWLKISQFEKLVKEKKQNCFIFIEEGAVNQQTINKRAEQRKKQRSHFLQDKKFIQYVNDNFICYRFNSETERVNFQGKEYKRIEEKGRYSHEFVNFLTESKTSGLATIVLKDKDFEFFEYKKSLLNIEEIQVLVDAEKLKADYITKNLGADNKNTKQAEQMLKRHSKRLQIAQENKMNKSVIQVRGDAKRLIKTLTYFVSGSYKETDLQSFIKTK